MQRFTLLTGLALMACTAPPASERRDLHVSLEAGHIHVYRRVAVAFTVRDEASCQDAADVTTCAGVPGLPITAFHKAGSSISEQALEPGILEDAGGGRYVWYRAYPSFGVNTVGLRFELDGHFYADAFPLETSRGGGEAYFCDIGSDSVPDHVFQVRWNTSAGPVRADGASVSFTIELSRSFNDPPLNTQQPFRNSMEALRPSELVNQLPEVRLMKGTASAAAEVAQLGPTYLGRGLFQVSRAFSAADLDGSAPTTYWLRIRFTDEKGCDVDGVADEDEYHFEVTP